MSPRVVARIEALLESGRRKQAIKGPSLLESAGEMLRNQLRSPILRHAIAALRRGNNEAAFALLREAVEEEPDQPESTQLLWEVAQVLGRPADAAAPMARLIRHQVAQGRADAGADHFALLAESAPDTVIDVASLVKIVSVLRTRLNAARGEKAQADARALLCDALRRSVDAAGGALTPPVALRIFEEARGLEMDVAKRAAQVALESTTLHEAKRAKLQEQLALLDQGVWPEGADALTPAVAEAVMRSGAAAPEPVPATKAVPAPKPVPAAKPPAAKPAPKPAAAKPAAPKPAPAKPTPAKPAAAKAAAAAPKAPAIQEEEKGPTSGRKTVALTQDEIEAASTRLAERMAARQKPSGPAAAAAKPAPAPEPDVAPAPPPPTVDPEATVLGVAAMPPASAPAPEPEPEVVGTITAEPFPEEEGFAIGGDLIEEEDGADTPLEVEPEDEDFALGITDMGPVLETDEEEASAEAAPAAEPAQADAAPAAVADVADADEADFAIGIQDDAEAALTPEPAAEATPELTPVPEPVAEPDVDDVIDVAFAQTFDQELTAEAEPVSESELVAEAEFAADSEAELATPIDDDEKPEAEASPLAEAVSEALASPTPAASALRAIDITPVELGSDGLVAYEVAQSQRTRIDYRAIEAVSVAEVAELGDAPVMLVYLVLRARAGRPRSALRLRCDTFDPGSLYPDRTNNGQALHAMLSDLLERTRALPLPDPDSALGLRPQHFEHVAEFEAAILSRLTS